MTVISFQPDVFDIYVECTNLCKKGELTVENSGGAFYGGYIPLKKRYIDSQNYYIVAGRWKLKNNKMNNTIQRRLKRERKIINCLWLFLAIVIALFIFSCSSDNDTCNCRKEVYNNSIQFLYDQPADESKCTGDKALRSDGNGNMYRYQCK